MAGASVPFTNLKYNFPSLESRGQSRRTSTLFGLGIEIADAGFAFATGGAGAKTESVASELNKNSGDPAKARIACQEDADPDIPILKEAGTEYVKAGSNPAISK